MYIETELFVRSLFLGPYYYVNCFITKLTFNSFGDTGIVVSADLCFHVAVFIYSDK